MGRRLPEEIFESEMQLNGVVRLEEICVKWFPPLLVEGKVPLKLLNEWPFC